eukprot:CAMPEP_0172211622 /NCGR_PEP_ID=MMETSP1050-20130122/36516_1 /TAXON_ID=233186 /ORGANISM="Cryptomonas curvata, Strain CCAP979/52" /LENGTH=225 /DNA_ID=CAMNT_0012892117 /DNA_START=303 /DNA_END=976 /DNA_ORIENTATION=-
MDLSRAIDNEEAKALAEKLKVERLAILRDALGIKDSTTNIDTSNIEAVGNIALMKKRMEVLFEEYLNQTSFFTRTKQHWQNFVSLERNNLSNERMRFDYTLNKITEYRQFLLKLATASTANQDIDAEISLRTAALAAYESKVVDMRRTNQDSSDAFNGYTNEIGDAVSCNPSCEKGTANTDVVFSFDVNGTARLFAALQVLSRMTLHFLHSCSRTNRASMAAQMA